MMAASTASFHAHWNPAYSPSEGNTSDDLRQKASKDLPTLFASGTDIWTGGELTEAQIYDYMKRLELFKDEPEHLRAEVLHSCLEDDSIRFELCHDFLAETHGMFYSHPALHHQHMDNLLLVALSAEAWNVTRFLLKTVDPEVILWTSQNNHSEGMTALHLVVMKNRRDILGIIMERLNSNQINYLIARQGTGEIFRGDCYNCSNPTTLALYCGHLDMFFDLIRFGGDVAQVDTVSGHGPMHTIIEYGTMFPERAREILHEVLTSAVTISWFCTKYGVPEDQFTQHQHNLLKSLLLKARNSEGYTAMTYSAKLGVHPVLVYIMNCEGVYKHTEWRLGARSRARYDMSEVDPSVTSLQTPHSPSVLELLVYEHGDRDLPALSQQPLCQLLITKWRQHRVQYTLMAVFHLVVLCLQTAIAVTVATHNHGNDSNSTQTDLDDIDADIYGFLLIRSGILSVCAIVGLYGIMELYEVWLALLLYIKGRLLWRSCKHYFVPWSIVFKLDEFDVFMVVYCGASLAWLPRLFDDTYIGDGLSLSIALVSGWYFMLFYTRAYKPTSFFNVMLSRMLFSDLLRFTMAMGILLVGFGVSLMVLVGQPLPDELSSMGNTIVTMVLLMVGMADLNFIENAKHPIFATVFSLIYVVLGAVLLLNMLIAALADTYAEFSGSRHSLWLKMRVRSVLVTERRSLKWFLRWRLNHIPEYKNINGVWFIQVNDTPSSKSERGLGKTLYRSIAH